MTKVRYRASGGTGTLKETNVPSALERFGQLATKVVLLVVLDDFLSTAVDIPGDDCVVDFRFVVRLGEDDGSVDAGGSLAEYVVVDAGTIDLEDEGLVRGQQAGFADFVEIEGDQVVGVHADTLLGSLQVGRCSSAAGADAADRVPGVVGNLAVLVIGTADVDELESDAG